MIQSIQECQYNKLHMSSPILFSTFKLLSSSRYPLVNGLAGKLQKNRQFLEYASTRGFQCKWCTSKIFTLWHWLFKPSPNQKWSNGPLNPRDVLCVPTALVASQSWGLSRPGRVFPWECCCRFYRRFFLEFLMVCCFHTNGFAWRNSGKIKHIKKITCFLLYEMWEYESVL